MTVKLTRAQFAKLMTLPVHTGVDPVEDLDAPDITRAHALAARFDEDTASVWAAMIDRISIDLLHEPSAADRTDNNQLARLLEVSSSSDYPALFSDSERVNWWGSEA